MKHPSNSLRTRLFLWYLISLIILAVFFYLAVHIFMLPYSTEIFIALIFVLALSGFFVVRQITSSLTDLTEQINLISSHNLDRQIKGIHTEDEIGNLAKAFNNLLERLSKAFKREQQFIADVAHELKTPLATQRSLLEVTLSKKRNNDEYVKSLEEILRENNHISSTLKNIMDLAWSETAIEQKGKQRFNLSDLMKDLCDIAEKMALSKSIKVTSSIDDDIQLNGFKDKLARAILNIIENSVKYTPEKGIIDITVRKKQHYAIVKVKDTGQGISHKDLPHIFDRFYRGSQTDKVFGSGLGLAISQSVITVHHGQVKVESHIGKGSTFSIELPLH